jgi:hypothetical protein
MPSVHQAAYVLMMLRAAGLGIGVWIFRVALR